MPRLQVQLVNDSGRTVGFGDRWWAHRVRNSQNGPILGEKHVGIIIACVDRDGRLLTQHRRHKIFDKVWSLSGDTHPYRIEGTNMAERLAGAARRCAKDELGVDILNWTKTLTVSYAARDPRDPRYCENELMHLLVARYGDLLRPNRRNVYDLRWSELEEISNDTRADLKKEPIHRKYAPWVHTMFSLRRKEIDEGLAFG